MAERKATSPRVTALQSKFDFDRGDQLALLDALPIASGEIMESKSRVKVSGRFALSVLRAIDGHARTTGYCWAAAKTIATRINASERHVRRAMRRLNDLQLLVLDTRNGKSSLCRINWGEVSLKSRKRPAQIMVGESVNSFSDPGQSDDDPGQSDADPGQSVRRSVTKRKKASSPSPLKSIGASAERSASDRWAVVVDLFLALPSDRLPTAWQAGLRAAQRAEVDPDYVTRVLQHYVAAGNAYHPGALVQRLRRSHASVSPETSWPVPFESTTVPASRIPSDAEMVRNIETRVVKAGRKRGATDQAIGVVIARELHGAGLDPTLSTWYRPEAVSCN